MMNHIKAMIIKYIVITFILYLVVGIYYQISLPHILWMGFIISLATYIGSDLKILPLWGTFYALLADFGISFVGIWTIGAIFFADLVPWLMVSIISALLIAVEEWFFHQYLVNRGILKSI